MVSELCDTHVNSLYSPIFGGRFVPLVCRFAEDRLFVTDTCSIVSNNLAVGDEIILIDSISPIDRLNELASYIPHSNRNSLLRDGSYATLITAKKKFRLNMYAKEKFSLRKFRQLKGISLSPESILRYMHRQDQN